MKVYIASPYTHGDNFVNVQRQIDAANKLLDAGLTPFAPLVMSSLLNMQRQRSPGEWLEYDFVWLDQCDVLLRLDGLSDGGDKEESRSLENYMPVYHDIDKLISDYKTGLLDTILVENDNMRDIL